MSPRRVSGIAGILALIAGCVAPSDDRATAPLAAPVPTPTIMASPRLPTVPLSVRGSIVLTGELSQGGFARGKLPAGFEKLTLDGETVRVAPDGSFLVAFDRDAGPIARLIATFGEGRYISQAVSIAPRDWPIERINAPLRGSVPSETFMDLRRPELAAIEAARAIHTGSLGWTQHFIWPVKGRISGRFGSQRIYQGVPASYHSGLDIATGTSGTPYVAPADGVVVLAASRPFSLEGNLVIIDHGMGLNSAFLHSSRLAVEVGDRVRQGQLIGYIGATGRATGPHLHWSLKWQDARLDPLLFLPEAP